MILVVIPGIVLAAGRSVRMGRPKPNLPIGPAGDTFLSHLVRTLLEAGVDDVVIVVGHEQESVMRSFAARGLPARFVQNADYASGQLSSLLAGLSVVDRPGVTAMLVSLVDVPFVSAGTIRAVVDRYHQTRARIVRPSRGGEHGHPLLIDRSLFELLRRADPGAGAKPVVRAHANREGEVELDDEGAFFDVDTPEDYERALRMFNALPARSENNEA
jgi:molybdenum cofactor cytidylyltransferase